MEGKNIVLLITGSIAVYKMAELIRKLKKRRANVKVIMSKSALEFITPLTLEVLSDNKVETEMFDKGVGGKISHIKIASQADILLVAPASANCIAKIAHGIADNLLTSIALASNAPLVIAPAMNVNMWKKEVTQENISILEKRGAIIVSPRSGDLACGVVGKGRLAPLNQILDSVVRAVKPQDMKDIEVIVTAGPTREFIDPIRYISNKSTGKMGYAIAKEAHLRGAKVTLITGPTSQKTPFGVNVIDVTTAKEMAEAVKNSIKELEKNPPAQLFVFKSAAVCDHGPEVTLEKKGKGNKGKCMSLPLSPNEDILFELGKIKEEFFNKTKTPLVLVGFAAETGTEKELEIAAKQKLETKNCDMIVANLAKDSFGRDTSKVSLADRNGRWLSYKEAPKETIAKHIVTRAKSLVYGSKPGSRMEPI